MHATEITADAFGVFRGEDLSRSLWSGYSETCVDSKCTSQMQSSDDINKIEQFFGQKSLRVNKDVAMSVGVFEDQYGNLIERGQAQLHADEGEKYPPMQVKNGVSSIMISTNEKAALGFTSIATSDNQTTQQLYRKIPDIPSTIPRLEPQSEAVDQGTILLLKSAPILDQFGNEAPLGLYLTSLLRSSTGRYSWIPIVLQNQAASEKVSTSALIGNYSATLSLGSRVSNTERYFVGPEKIEAASFKKITYDASTEVISFEIASILTEHGHLVQDAAPIWLSLNEANGRTSKIRAWTIDGGTKGIFPLDAEAFPISLKLTSDFGELNYSFGKEDVMWNNE